MSDIKQADDGALDDKDLDAVSGGDGEGDCPIRIEDELVLTTFDPNPPPSPWDPYPEPSPCDPDEPKPWWDGSELL